MENVLYVGYYDVLEDKIEKRNYSLAAAKKMDYIAKKIVNIGYKVNIVILCHVIVKKLKKPLRILPKAFH